MCYLSIVENPTLDSATDCGATPVYLETHPCLQIPLIFWVSCLDLNLTCGLKPVTILFFLGFLWDGLVLGIEHRALCIQGKWSTIELHPLLCFYFDMGSFFLFYVVVVCVCMCTRFMMYMWKSEGNFWGVSIFFALCGY